MDRKEEIMADELAEAVQIIRVAYDGIEIAMKVGSDGIEAMKKVLAVLKGMLDYEKNLGRTSMRKLLMRGGDLQVLEFSNYEMRKVKRLAKKYGILYSMMPNINKGQTEIIFHSEATPRINVMLQKLKSGQISTFDDYVKKSDNDGKNKLIDYFQKQKDGNERFHSQEAEKTGEIIEELYDPNQPKGKRKTKEDKKPVEKVKETNEGFEQMNLFDMLGATGI